MEIHFYVYEPSTGYTRFRHDSRTAAEREAERLALLNPGKEFYVLAAIAKCSYKAVTWNRVEVEEQVPF